MTTSMSMTIGFRSPTKPRRLNGRRPARITARHEQSHLPTKRTWDDTSLELADRPSMTAQSRPRTVHVIDFESGVGGGSASSEEIQQYWNIYRHEAVGIGPRDLVLVGVAERTARKFRSSVHDKSIKWRIGDDGPDGADHALLDAVKVQHIARRYDRLVIASRDHIFAPLAREARALGMTVHIVVGETKVSRELKAAAGTLTTIRTHSRTQALDNLAKIRQVARAAHEHVDTEAA